MRSFAGRGLDPSAPEARTGRPDRREVTMTYSDSNPPQGDLDYYVLVVQDNRGIA